MITFFKKHQSWHKLLSYAVFTLLILSIMTSISMAIAVWVFSYQLPQPGQLTNRKISQSTQIFDRNGQLLYEVYSTQNRTLVQLHDLPQPLINATLAAEDADFYKHGGVDPRSLLNAVWQTFVEGHTIGGSTITQQLVKNTLLSNQRTLIRKAQEAILSIQIEQHYAKDQILQMYVNEVPYGGQVYGIQAAAHTFFGQDAKDMDLAQSALLAGLTQSPTGYSPFTHPQAAIDRQHYVLHLMQKAGFITDTQETQAKAEVLQFAPPQTVLKAPWFTLWVKQQLEQTYGNQKVQEGGLRIHTTLDLGKQLIAEDEINKQLDRLAQANAQASQAALVSMDPKTGEILAMVGSKDYFAADGQFNAAMGLRQPGSAIKPFVYLTALTQHVITPATLLNDTLTSFPVSPGQPPYIPQEADGKFWGPILARDALANSRNIPALQVMQKISTQDLLNTVKKAGITTYGNPDQYGLSIALGAGEVEPLELADAYSTLATGGQQHNPVSILKVEDAEGHILQQYAPDASQAVFNPQTVFQISNILSDNAVRQRLFGAHNLLELTNRPAAVKTGTTNDNRDAWTAGYTPSLTTVVWVGNFNNTAMNGIQGSTGATPIWHYFMDRALADTPVENFTAPAGLVTKPITVTGQLSCNTATTVRNEFFIPNTEPTNDCTTPNFDQINQYIQDQLRKSSQPRSTPIHLFPFNFR
jgi:1A family penicillin-binding protein